MAFWDEIARHISASESISFNITSRQGLGGGSINAAYRISGGDQHYFVKLNDAARLDMFEAEAEGLLEMAQSNSIRVPRPVCCGTSENRCYLVLEFVDIGSGSKVDDVRLGEHLAQMHRATRPVFGWHRNNTIGATPQLNTPSDNWVEFWRHQRLSFQLDLAARNGYTGRLQHNGEELLARLDDFFTGHAPDASLLHGDLWSGNYGALYDGSPVIFDPAVYFGDRETDLAMTELFGGFPAGFYDAYRAAYPLDAGYTVRKTLYNLYHILNHVNLFGGGYLSQAETMLERLLSEVR